MKIILREHVEHLGERGQVVNVAVGYARNFLLPKALAMEATPGNLKLIEHQRKAWAAKEQHEQADAQALARSIEALQLSVERKAGDTGTLYGSVTNVDVAELLAARGVEVDRRRIQLAEPIKTLGEHEIEIKLHRTTTARVKLNVLASDQSPE
ncbi:MAG TPA: 50S ribosomal protein L9 [Candidatus Polarisedimenticolaceae bacterium]|nr:50S ribosomal protein L9 [Candidatus Polarisedimenticolaceae bacterium]